MLNQIINTVIMYIYLRYYDWRLRNDQRFMIRELHAALKADLIKKGVIRP